MSIQQSIKGILASLVAAELVEDENDDIGNEQQMLINAASALRLELLASGDLFEQDPVLSAFRKRPQTLH